MFGTKESLKFSGTYADRDPSSAVAKDKGWDDWWERNNNKVKRECLKIKENISKELQHQEITDETFSSFIINFVPQPENLNKFCTEDVEKNYVQLVPTYIKEIILSYKTFVITINIDSYNNLLKSISEYFDYLFQIRPEGDRSICPLLYNIKNTSCKNMNTPEKISELSHYIRVFLDLFVDLLEKMKTSNPENMQTIISNRNVHTRSILKTLLFSFFINFALMTLNIPLELYKQYFDKINNIVGYNWFRIDCPITGTLHPGQIPGQEIMSNYTCGRAFEIITDTDDGEENYKVILFDTISPNNMEINYETYYKYKTLKGGRYKKSKKYKSKKYKSKSKKYKSKSKSKSKKYKI
jgi:hypothetical protein